MRVRFSRPATALVPMRAILAVLLLVAAAIPVALPASASCSAVTGPHDPLTGARVAFVGTVTSTASGGHRALVRVQSVWVGPGLPAEVEVQSDVLPGPGEGIEDIASFDQGQMNLFVPENSAEPFKFPACDGPQSLTKALDRYRPQSARSPAAIDAGLSVQKHVAFWMSAQLPLLISILLAVVAATSIIARSRRRASSVHPGARARDYSRPDK